MARSSLLQEISCALLVCYPQRFDYCHHPGNFQYHLLLCCNSNLQRVLNYWLLNSLHHVSSVLVGDRRGLHRVCGFQVPDPLLVATEGPSTQHQDLLDLDVEEYLPRMHHHAGLSYLVP